VRVPCARRVVIGKGVETRNAERDWSVYLVRRADGALYTGVALDVRKRLEEHRAGRGAKALRGRAPLALVVHSRVGERGLAQRVESRIKLLSKASKERLVASRGGVRRLIARERRAADAEQAATAERRSR